MIIVDVGKELEVEFKKKCKQNGVKIKDVVKDAVETWMLCTGDSKKNGKKNAVSNMIMAVSKQLEAVNSEFNSIKVAVCGPEPSEVKPDWYIEPEEVTVVECHVGEHVGDNDKNDSWIS